MIEWTDKSDRGSAFYDGQVVENESTNIETTLTEMFDFLVSNIVGKGNAAEFNRLLFEVNCDTGRVIAAATTDERRENGLIDGCSVRIQSLQDHWYDLLESGRSDQQFAEGIANKETELGRAFRNALIERLDDLRRTCSAGGFEYVAYGSDPGEVLVQEHFFL